MLKMILTEQIIKENALLELDKVFKNVDENLVPLERRQQWVDTLYKNLASEYAINENKLKLIQKNMLWHINRLKGFGGSDMVVLMQEYLGERPPFSNSEQILREKLLLSVPKVTNCNMLIGTKLEENARNALKNYFLDQNISYEVDIESKNKILKYSKKINRNNNWLVGNPDDILLINGKRCIVDYKVSMININEYNTPNYYKYQLLHYKLLAKEADINIDKLFIASYIPDNKNQFTCKLSQINISNEELAEYTKNIYDIGKIMWEYRNQGIVKNISPQKPTQLYLVGNISHCIPSETQNIQKNSLVFGVLNELSKVTDKITDSRKKQIIEILKNTLSINELNKNDFLNDFLDNDTPTIKIPDLQGINISVNITLDIEKLALSDNQEIKKILSDENNYKKIYSNKDLQEITNRKEIIQDEIKLYINNSVNAKQMIIPQELQLFIQQREQNLQKFINNLKFKKDLDIQKVKTQILQIEEFKQNPTLILNFVNINNFRFTSVKKEFENILKEQGLNNLDDIIEKTLKNYLNNTINNYLNTLEYQENFEKLQPLNLDTIIDNSNLLNDIDNSKLKSKIKGPGQ